SSLRYGDQAYPPAVTRRIGRPLRSHRRPQQQRTDRRDPTRRLKEPQRLRLIAHEQALRLLIILKRLLVRFPPDARLLVSAERRMRRVEVIAVGPHATRLDFAS